MKYSSVFVKIGLGLCLPYNLVIELALAMGLAIPAIALLKGTKREILSAMHVKELIQSNHSER